MDHRISLMGLLLLLNTNNAFPTSIRCSDVDEVEKEVIEKLVNEGMIKKIGSEYVIDKKFISDMEEDFKLDIERAASDTICR